MKRKLITRNSKTLEDLADPFGHIPLKERIRMSPDLAVDSDEFRIESEGHYLRFVYGDEYERRRVQILKDRLK